MGSDLKLKEFINEFIEALKNKPIRMDPIADVEWLHTHYISEPKKKKVTLNPEKAKWKL